MSKIKKDFLTEEEKKLIPIVRDKWLQILPDIVDNGLDEDKVIEGVKWLYDFCDYDEPIVFFMDSPFGCQILANTLNNIEDNIRNNIRSNIWNNIEYSEVVWSVYGHDVDWAGFTEYFNRIGLKFDENWREYIKWLEKGVPYTIFFKGVAIISQSPTHLFRDEDNRLHNEKGSAIKWEDGYEIFCWHGTPIPEKAILHSEQITKEDILSEGNAEVRRCLVEIIGGHRFGELLELEEVDRWERESVTTRVLESGTIELVPFHDITLLMKTKEPDDLVGERLPFIHVTDPSTGRKYYIPVPFEVRSAREGWMWTYIFDEDEDVPLIET